MRATAKPAKSPGVVCLLARPRTATRRPSARARRLQRPSGAPPSSIVWQYRAIPSQLVTPGLDSRCTCSGFSVSSYGTTSSLDRCGHVRVGGKRLWTAGVGGELTQSLRNRMSPGHLWQAMRGTPAAVAQRDTRCHCVYPAVLCQLRRCSARLGPRPRLRRARHLPTGDRSHERRWRVLG